MTWTVRYAPRAAKALRKLDKPIDEWEDLLESWLEANNFTAELKK